MEGWLWILVILLAVWLIAPFIKDHIKKKYFHYW